MGTVDQQAAGIPWAYSPQGGSTAHIRERWRDKGILNVLEATLDGSVVALCIVAADGMCRELGLRQQIHYSWETLVSIAAAFGILFVFLLALDGAYCWANSLLSIKETERILRLSAFVFVLIFPLAYFTGDSAARWVVCLSLIFVSTLLIASKQLFYTLLRAAHIRGNRVRNVVIYGAGYSGRRVFSALLRSPKLGLIPVAMVDDDPVLKGVPVFELGYSHRCSVSVIAGPVTSDLLLSLGAGLVVIAIPSLPNEKFCEVLKAAQSAGSDLVFVPGYGPVTEPLIDFLDIDGLLLASYGFSAVTFYEPVKRALDFFLALALLCVLSPILALIPILIRLDSAGPALFVQQRVGKGGRFFSLYKFRSMRTDSPAYAFSPTDHRDSRITRIGRILRRTSLDELPQLLNVLIGDMSLVGPRPEMPFLVEQYTPRQRQRLEVTPGLTGLWQISADRAYQIHENIHYDLYYLRNRGFFLDLAILLHTAAFAMRGI